MGIAKLYFNIRNQSISRVDNMKVVSMSHNYIVAHFDFLTEDWDGVSKLAIFTKGETSYKMTMNQNNETFVPWELLEDVGTIKVSVYGGDLITANTAQIVVEQSGYTTDAENEHLPTPDVWEQLLEKIDNMGKDVDGGTFEDWHTGEGE